MEYIGHYLTLAAIFVAIDSVWLGLIANKLYKSHIGGLLKEKPNFVAAAAFYLLYIAGLQIFALEPALERESLAYAMTRGALLGLLMYATYDLTNLSTLKNWPVKITIIDMLWGTFITGLTVTLAYLVLS